MGHRGAAGLAPENTLAGFRAAAATGVAAVELDVYLTADGVPVLSHDDDLTRMTGCAMRVTRTTLGGLQDVDAGARFGAAFRGEGVPTLSVALKEIAALGMGVNIEIKRQRADRSRVLDAIAAVVEAAWPAAAPMPMISSFDEGLVAAALRRLPAVPRALIATRLPARATDICTTLGCVSLHLRHDAVTPRAVGRLHDAGFQVGVYTVNDAALAAGLWAVGVDCVITDRPDLLLAAGAHGAHRP